MKTKIILLGLMALLAGSCADQKRATESWPDELQSRIKRDFCLSREDVKQYIQKYIPDVTDEQMDYWEQTKALECMVIDGEKRYFRKAGPNLFRLDPECIKIKQQIEPPTLDVYKQECQRNIPAIIASVKATGKPQAEPKRIRMKYTLTVDTDAVPAGETVRCWLPFPRRDLKRQTDVRLISTSLPQYTLADADQPHSTLYMEQKAEAGKPTVFSETFEYTSWGEKHLLDTADIKPYDTTTELYKTYTAQRDKHVIFSPRMRQLADSLTAGLNNPLDKARAIFNWIRPTFPWAGAREYSTMDNIPEYVIENRHGDCGMVSLLFITMCRICGIPAHFQSGFMTHPNDKNLHDWAEIYFEGVGWVPVDQSFGNIAYCSTPEENSFFYTGIDSWRLYVNSDYGMPLQPQKWFTRSETVDFQVGEVEWRGGNLFYDKWNWDWEVEYLD